MQMQITLGVGLTDLRRAVLGAVPPSAPAFVQATPDQAYAAGTAIAPVDFAARVTGTAPITFALASGTLPAGIALTSAGLLSGTPTAAAASRTITVRATNGQGSQDTSFAVVVTAVAGTAPAFVQATPDQAYAAGTAIAPVDFAARVTGTAPITFALASGTLPTGIALTPAGLLSGTPTAAAASRTITVRATNGQGSRDTSFAVVVTAVAGTVDLAAATASLRFPEDNGTTARADSSGVLVQAGAGTTNWGAGDGVMGCIVRLERTRRLKGYQFGVWGTQGGGANTASLAYYGATSGATAQANRFLAKFRGASQSAVPMLSAPWTEDGALVVLKRTGTDWVCDWYSLETGAKFAGTPATYATNTLFSFGSNFLLGGNGFAAPALPAADVAANAVTHWPGEIEAVFAWNGTAADADLAAIALGAPLESRLAPAGFRYARVFDGTPASYGPPAWATADASAPATAWNGSTLVPGSRLRRQGTAEWLTMTPFATGHVFGLPAAATSRKVRFSGTAGGIAGGVEVQVIHAATGAVIRDWTSAGSIAGGAWTGEITLPETAGWWVARARAATRPALVAEMRNPFGVGHKFLWLGQSQMGIAWDAVGYAASPGAGDVRGMSRLARDAARDAATLTRFGVADRADAAAYFLNQYRRFKPYVPVLLVDAAENGTGMIELVTDANPGRRWSDLQALFDGYGNDITAVLHQWGSNDMTNPAGFEAVLNALVSGTGPLAGNHSLAAALAPGWIMGYAPLTRHTVQSGMEAAIAAGRKLAAANPATWVVGPPMADFRIEDGGGGHPDITRLNSNPMLGARLAVMAARAVGAVGADASGTPAGSAVTGAGTAVLTVAFTLPNGGALTSPAPNALRGWAVSTDGGASYAETGFAAAVAGNTVRLTKASGVWPAAGTRVRLLVNGASRTATGSAGGAQEDAIVAGALYETWAPDVLGLGMPVPGFELAAG